MSTEEIDRRLAEHGVVFDLDTCKFYDGHREIELHEVHRLLPGLSEEEIEIYQQAKIDGCGLDSWFRIDELTPTGNWETRSAHCRKCGGSGLYKSLGHLYQFDCPNCHTSVAGTFYPGQGEST